MEYEVNMNAIGTYIRYLTGDHAIAQILGYEIRKDITYVIVESEVMESRINILNEGRIFEFVE